MKPKDLVFLVIVACIGRSILLAQGSSVCKQRIVYNWTYHGYGSSPDISTKDNQVVRACDHNPVYPCWNFCTCGTSGVREVQVIGSSYNDFAELRIDGTIVPGMCTVDDICTRPHVNKTTVTADPENCAIGNGICGIVIFFLCAVIFCCILEKIPCIRKVMRPYCHDRIPWGRDNSSELPTSTPQSDAQFRSGARVSNLPDRSLLHPPLPEQLNKDTSASQLPPEGQEETQLHAERRGTGPTTLASFQRTTGNSQSKRSSQPPLPAATNDTQSSEDKEPTDGERVGPPTEETCTAC